MEIIKLLNKYADPLLLGFTKSMCFPSIAPEIMHYIYIYIYLLFNYMYVFK